MVKVKKYPGIRPSIVECKKSRQTKTTLEHISIAASSTTTTLNLYHVRCDRLPRPDRGGGVATTVQPRRAPDRLFVFPKIKRSLNDNCFEDIPTIPFSVTESLIEVTMTSNEHLRNGNHVGRRLSTPKQTIFKNFNKADRINKNVFPDPVSIPYGHILYNIRF